MQLEENMVPGPCQGWKTSVTLLEETDRRKERFRHPLLVWFQRNARELPWRRTRDPYRVWLSEILLQQTRLQTALPYYERFVAAFPTVHALAAAKEEHVLKLWEGLGYYTRARNLHRAAKRIVHDLGGHFPTTADEWQKIPGVGRYTACAIASIVFGECVPVVDGNVKRVLSRVFDIRQCIDDAKTQRLLWTIAMKLVPRKSPGDFNQALMELGSRVCTPRAPRCIECPLRRICDARSAGRQELLPIRRQKSPLPHYNVVAAAIRKNGRYLFGRRPPRGLLGGLWEFPGGKVKPGESRRAALKREMKEELGTEVSVGPLLASVKHAYSHFRVTLHVYLCEHTKGQPRSLSHTQLRWIPKSYFARYAFPSATRKVLELL
jgi:A/G-specific adenine glycosylase